MRAERGGREGGRMDGKQSLRQGNIHVTDAVTFCVGPAHQQIHKGYIRQTSHPYRSLLSPTKVTYDKSGQIGHLYISL